MESRPLQASSPVPDPQRGSGFVDRRRPGWGEFRHAFPGILTTMTVALVALLAMDGWLVYKRIHYANEIGRLRSNMTGFERQRTDAILASNENRLRIMIALVQRQARLDKRLHLMISVDSATMSFVRDGAILRRIPIQVGAERRVGTPPDTVHMAVPRGTRTVESLLEDSAPWQVPAWVYADRGVAVPPSRDVKGALGPVAIVLNGGTVIYSMPNVGPLNDSTYVMPGSIRVSAADLKAIAPNLIPGMTVYFY